MPHWRPECRNRDENLRCQRRVPAVELPADQVDTLKIRLRDATRDRIRIQDDDVTDKPTPCLGPAAAPLGSLRALWPFVRRHSGLFTAWLLALAVSSAATLSLPPAVKQMIDHGFSSGGQINRPSPCCSGGGGAGTGTAASTSCRCWAKRSWPTCAAACTPT
jgi:hypothetical protein